MGIPSVLINKITGEIIRHADYPVIDMGIVPGLDHTTYEWLVKYQPNVAPDYDSRIFILKQIEAITTTPHPDYPHLNQYRITYELEKRPIEDVKQSVEHAEQEANNGVFPYSKQMKILTLGLAVLFRKVEGMTLTQKETNIKEKVLNLATKMWKNDAALKAKLAEIDAGTEPNFDEGWEKE